MIATADVRSALERQNPNLVKELVEARNLRDMNKEIRNDIARALSRTDDERFKDMPVVNVSSRDTRMDLKEKKDTPEDIVRRYERLRGFGAALNLDASNAYNADVAKKKAERVGLDSDKELSFVRRTTLDYSSVYRNVTIAEKDLGVTKTSPVKEEKVPLINPIDWSKYSKWNDKANQEEKEREERERQDREERDREKEEEYGLAR